MTLPTSQEFPAQSMSVRTAKCSKCPPFARTHLRSRSRHWFTALSIIFWSNRRHSSISRSFRWSTSRIWHSFLQNPPNRVVHRIEIWTVRWPILWADEVGCLCWQQCNSLTGSVGCSTVLLEGEEITRHRTNGWQQLLSQQRVAVICDSSWKELKIS